jgi:hypothetical protein
MDWKNEYRHQIWSAVDSFLNGDDMQLRFVVDHIVRKHPELKKEQVAQYILSLTDQPLGLPDLPGQYNAGEKRSHNILRELEIRSCLTQDQLDAESMQMFAKPFKDLKHHERELLHSKVIKPIKSVEKNS